MLIRYRLKIAKQCKYGAKSEVSMKQKKKTREYEKYPRLELNKKGVYYAFYFENSVRKRPSLKTRNKRGVGCCESSACRPQAPDRACTAQPHAE